MKQSFPKEERLKSLKKIQKVINEGKIIRFGIIKICWMVTPTEQEDAESFTPRIKAGFSVPKKKIKRAVERNQIRRKMKEIFRLHKNQFHPTIPQGKQLLLFFIFQKNKNLPYKDLEKDICSALNRIKECIKTRQNENQDKF